MIQFLGYLFVLAAGTFSVLGFYRMYVEMRENALRTQKEERESEADVADKCEELAWELELMNCDVVWMVPCEVEEENEHEA